MPSHQELRKLSDEHKAMLAQKVVTLLMGAQATSTSPLGTEGELLSSSAAAAGGVGGGAETAVGGRGQGEELPEMRPRTSSKRGHSRSILAAPPLCVPEVEEKTHAKK